MHFVYPPSAKLHAREIVAALLLVAITLAALGGVCSNGFINYDDPDYVTHNPDVQAGLTPPSFCWAWTTFHAANWHPLTWLSLQLDWQLYRGAAWGFHLTNLLLHLASTLVLFAVLRRLTGTVWRSACVAALFAVHPLRVESVAWVAERKDVLSVFFGLLTIWAYVRYAERPGLARYLVVVLWLGLGLLAKPMLVTLPAVLLLLDYWPLRRWRRLRGAPADGAPPGPHAVPTFPLSRLLWEKAPLLGLAFGSSVVTLFAQRIALVSPEQSPLEGRLENAVMAYVKYLGMTLWPGGLAAYYPRQPLPLGPVLAAALLLLVVSVLVLWAGRRRPYLAVGWLWFVGMLAPVIGLVQVGDQALADRYTYLPHVGLFLLLVWGGYDLLARRRGGRVLAAALAVGLVAACIVVTRVQTSYWTDSVTLWTHAVQVTEPNPTTYEHLGKAYTGEDKYEKAALWLAKAVRLDPNDPEGQYELGEALVRLGMPQEAEEHLLLALRRRPDWAEAHLELGGAFLYEGRTAEAASEFREALRLRPGYRLAQLDLGMALAGAYAEQGHFDEACTAARQALALASAAGLPDLAEQIRQRLRLYEDHQTPREAPGPTPP